MRYTFRSLSPQPGMTDLDLVQAACALRQHLEKNPVLTDANLIAATDAGALGIEAIVHTKRTKMAVLIAATAADEEWVAALRELGYEDHDRHGRLEQA